MTSNVVFHNLIQKIDFDEKQQHELLQILMKVFVSIDPKLNSSYEHYFNDDKIGINEILSFLSIIRYKDMPIQEEEGMRHWIERICNSDKEIIYSILVFCFSQYDKVKKRAYLAPFLTPIQLPLDISMTQRDDTLNNIANKYQSLQEEFKEMHMFYEEEEKKAKGRGDESIKEEIENLQEERIQLQNQVEVLNNNSSDDPVFVRIFETTTALRKEEEEEASLKDRIMNQKDALAAEETKLKQLQRQFSSLQSTASADGGSPDAIMNELQKKLVEVTMTVRSDLVSKRVELQRKIDDIEGKEEEKCCTDDDLDSVREIARELEEEHIMKQKMFEKEKLKRSYTKISMFKQVRRTQLNNFI